MRTILIIAMLAAMGLAGCTAPESGTASIYVKDAPTDEFDEIHVVFTKVEVHRSGDGSGGGSGNGTGNETGGAWITLFENATGRDIDLLDASGARAAFLGEAELEAGSYQQIRVHVTHAYGIQGDERINFTVSSGTLKLVRGFTVEEGSETRIVLDFDLDRAIKEQGNGQWRMTPVVGKSFVDIVEDDESGADVHEEGEVTEIDDLE